jgi:RNA polymerase sigma factor (sigma-70 family)
MNPGDQALNQAVGELRIFLNQAASELAVFTAPSFEAFYTQHQHGWVRYVYVETGSREVAEQITDSLTAHMASTWHCGQGPQHAARHAWEVLKATVARWLEQHGADSAFAETAAFDRVSRILERRREAFAAMEESLGLFSAISRLPKRQYESIVLHFVLDYPYDTAARLMGVPESAVRANVFQAKKRLAKELGLPHLIETEALNRVHPG